MKKMAGKYGDAVKILAFDNMLKLRAMFQSYSAVEKITGKSRQSIQKCCKGNMVSCLGYYWREVPEDIIIDMDEDLGKLSLIDFDEFSGNDRIIYATSKMKKGELIKECDYKRKNYILLKQRLKRK